MAKPEGWRGTIHFRILSVASGNKERSREKDRSNEVRRRWGASAETYLDLLLRNILGLGDVSIFVFIKADGLSIVTYQVAHNDLAVTSGSGAGCLSALGTGIANRLDSLLDSTGRGNRSLCTVGRAALRATASGGGATLVGGELIERLIELARHDDGV